MSRRWNPAPSLSRERTQSSALHRKLTVKALGISMSRRGNDAKPFPSLSGGRILSYCFGSAGRMSAKVSMVLEQKSAFSTEINFTTNLSHSPQAALITTFRSTATRTMIRRAIFFFSLSLTKLQWPVDSFASYKSLRAMQMFQLIRSVRFVLRLLATEAINVSVMRRHLKLETLDGV